MSTPSASPRVRRLHRVLGLALALPLFAWAATGHTALPRRRVELGQQIQRGARLRVRVASQLEIPGGGTEMPMAHQALNRVQVDAGFEEMGREAVSPMPHTA